MDADPDRLGVVGFSLGAATVMTYIAANPSGKVKVLADFFGFLTPAIRAGLGNFPPTIFFHNKDDQVVPVWHSHELDRLLPSTIEHELVPPYEEKTQLGNHAFRPGGAADLDSREKAKLPARLDPDDVALVIRADQGATTEVIRRWGGRVAKCMDVSCTYMDE